MKETPVAQALRELQEMREENERKEARIAKLEGAFNALETNILAALKKRSS